MKINRNNYEAWFIDYLEGNLDETRVDDFIEFLQQNPDLKEELSLFETVSATPEEMTFSKKEQLYKEKYDAEKEFEYTAVARLEGDISPEENIEFERYLSVHPEKQKVVGLFEKTKLQPDKSVVFSKKNKLYHYSAGRTILLWTSRVAAVLVVAVAIYTFIDRSPGRLNFINQVAVVENESPKKENTREVKEVPVKKEKKEVPEGKETTPVKPAAKKAEPKPEPVKSLRENSKGRLGSDDLALLQIREKAPAELEKVAASLQVEQPEVALAVMNIAYTEQQETVYEERLLADVVREKTGIGNLSVNKIKKAGLSLVSSLSNDKFNYETNEEGEITEINYDSRLLAFSIPTKNEGAGE